MEKLYVSLTFNVKVCPNTSSISPSWRFRKYEGADVKNGPRVLVKWGPRDSGCWSSAWVMPNRAGC